MEPNILYNSVTAGGLLAMLATEAVKGICALVRTIRRSTARFSTRRQGVAICLGLTWLSLGQVSEAAEQVSQAADDQRAREIVDRVAQLFVSQSSIANGGNADHQGRLATKDLDAALVAWRVEHPRPHSPDRRKMRARPS